MQKMLDHGDSKFSGIEKQSSPFMDAAGMVLSVGMTVLGGIGKALKSTIGLLLPSTQKPSGKEVLENLKNRQHTVGDRSNAQLTSQDLNDKGLIAGSLPTKI